MGASYPFPGTPTMGQDDGFKPTNQSKTLPRELKRVLLRDRQVCTNTKETVGHFHTHRYSTVIQIWSQQCLQSKLEFGYNRGPVRWTDSVSLHYIICQCLYISSIQINNFRESRLGVFIFPRHGGLSSTLMISLKKSSGFHLKEQENTLYRGKISLTLG